MWTRLLLIIEGDPVADHQKLMQLFAVITLDMDVNVCYISLIITGLKGYLAVFRRYFIRNKS